MPTYVHKPIRVNAKPYTPGMEDRIMYHIHMFGDFTAKECIDAGFIVSSKDFKEYPHQHAEILTKKGWKPVTKKDMVLTYGDGKKEVMAQEQFHQVFSFVPVN